MAHSQFSGTPRTSWQGPEVILFSFPPNLGSLLQNEMVISPPTCMCPGCPTDDVIQGVTEGVATPASLYFQTPTGQFSGRAEKGSSLIGRESPPHTLGG